MGVFNEIDTWGGPLSPAKLRQLSRASESRMMAQTEMKTETSINSFAEEGGQLAGRSSWLAGADSMVFRRLNPGRYSCLF